MHHAVSSHSRRRGSVLVLVAAAIVVLLGCAALAVDYSVLLADRNRLQRACDAGALAGAAFLNPSDTTGASRAKAQTEAVKVARFNGLTDSEVTAANVTFLDNDTKLQLSARRIRPLYFIRVFGTNDGVVVARATAGISARFTPQVLPIGITPETYDTYRADSTVRELTLSRTQDTPLIRTILGLTTFDPFVLTDLRSAGEEASHGSPAQMQRQLAGEEILPVAIGDAPSSIRSSLSSQSSKFKEGIAEIFRKSAQAPWLDPPTGVTSEGWDSVGTRFNDIISGASPRDNPRVVSLFITPPVDSQSGNFNYPVIGFAPVYIESVTDTLGVVKMKVRFFNVDSPFSTQPVKLLD